MEKSVYNFNFDETEAIINCNIAIIDYLSSEKVLKEERFGQLCREIMDLTDLPDCVFDKVKDFVNNTLSQIVYDPVNTFPDSFNNDTGCFIGDVWCFFDEECDLKANNALIARLKEFVQQAHELYREFGITFGK